MLLGRHKLIIECIIKMPAAQNGLQGSTTARRASTRSCGPDGRVMQNLTWLLIARAILLDTSRMDQKIEIRGKLILAQPDETSRPLTQQNEDFQHCDLDVLLLSHRSSPNPRLPITQLKIRYE
jgi:hypothetical protein